MSKDYLNDRKAKGFNTLIVNILDDTWKQLADGTQPFLTSGDFSSPNEKNFDHVDAVMQLAADRGFLMMTVPVYIGCCQYSWKEELYENGPAKVRAFGRFLGKRYSKFQNILWTIGGDRNPDGGLAQNPGGYREALNQLALGLKEAGGAELFSAHTARTSSAIEQYPRESWLNVNNIYAYHPEENFDPHVFIWADKEYGRKSRVLPSFLIESSYENGVRKGQDDQMLRRQLFWALLRGACGHLFGSDKIWGGQRGWKESLNLPGSLDMQRIKALFDQVEWWTLVPDTDNQLLRWGYGGFGKADYAVAALSKDRQIAMFYLPSSRRIEVDLGQMEGATTGRWWNPLDGKFTTSEPKKLEGRVVSFQAPAPTNIFSSDVVRLLESNVRIAK